MVLKGSKATFFWKSTRFQQYKRLLNASRMCMKGDMMVIIIFLYYVKNGSALSIYFPSPTWSTNASKACLDQVLRGVIIF